MPIELDTPRTGGQPVLKRQVIGEQFVGGVIKFEQRDQLKNDQPIVKDNGKHKQEQVVWLLTLESDMEAGIGGEVKAPERGEVVRVILPGGAFGQWIDAGKELKAAVNRGVSVGDTFTYTTTHGTRYKSTPPHSELGMLDTAEKIQKYRSDPKSPVGKTETLAMRGELKLEAPTDTAFVEECEALYHEMADSIPAGDDGGDTEADPWD